MQTEYEVFIYLFSPQHFYIITQHLPIGKYNIAPLNTYSHFEIVYWSASLFNLAVTLKLVTAMYAETLVLFKHMM